MGSPFRPVWFIQPTDQFVELGVGFSMELRASDPDGVDDWWISSGLFSITPIDASTAIVRNISLVLVGVYDVEVRAFNPSNDYCSARFLITVQDTTAPVFVTAPESETIQYGESVNQLLVAEDLSDIDDWEITNNNYYFSINYYGRLQNRRTLSVGRHSVTVRVTDEYDNSRSASCTITVTGTPFPSNPLFLAGYAVTIVFILLVCILLLIRSRRDSSPRSEPVTRSKRGVYQCQDCGLDIQGRRIGKCPGCGVKPGQCIVCHTTVEIGEMYLNCPHCQKLAHRSHLLEWLKVKGVCPFCQRRLRKSDVV